MRARAPSGKRMRGLIRCGLLATVCLVLTPITHAHKLILSVYATGDRFEGELGFSDGTMAADATIHVSDRQGNALAQIITDAEGFFTYNPAARADHIFHANLGAGHAAEVHLGADELPLGQARGDAKPVRPITAPIAAVPKDQTQLDETRLAALIAQEIKPLRKEIASYKEQRNLQTLLGGIGYIIGLCGIAFYLAARQKLKHGSR
ncbi:MAG: cobalt ABC transporter permease [Gammaproteobacteria bacterium]|nr:cobalt ABC transporter permease [Gammaproteobacteria bacterium]